MKTVYEITEINPMTEDCQCGFIRISNGVQVWFGIHHEVKSLDQAKGIANMIVHALNAKS